MAILHGITAPAGPGMVVEVHLDIAEAPSAFLSMLGELGFESDPFLRFNPVEYRHHFTGRTRSPEDRMRTTLEDVNQLIDQVLAQARDAGVGLYAESELVRQIYHFDESSEPRSLQALDDLSIEVCTDHATAKADVHVEFKRGTIPAELFDLIESKGFYWVVTPASDRFPAEEIATVQTSTYRDASLIYSRLIEQPLPVCTGIHLEQKLRMVPSLPGLTLPPVSRLGAPLSASTKPAAQLAEMCF